MSIITERVGKAYPPIHYAIGREKVREYASAVGEINPIHFDVDAARAAGYPDVVAPPMFAVVYQMPAVMVAMLDPDIGVDYARMVHGAQTFRWQDVAVAGDEMETIAAVRDITQRDGIGFYIFETVTKNQRRETVCTGTWTSIVRGVS
jgi:acyl dehydratase